MSTVLCLGKSKALNQSSRSPFLCFCFPLLRLLTDSPLHLPHFFPLPQSFAFASPASLASPSLPTNSPHSFASSSSTPPHSLQLSPPIIHQIFSFRLFFFPNVSCQAFEDAFSWSVNRAIRPCSVLSRLLRPFSGETGFTPILRPFSVRPWGNPSKLGRSELERPSFKSLLILIIWN